MYWKLKLKNPICCQSGPLWDQIWHPWQWAIHGMYSQIAPLWWQCQLCQDLARVQSVGSFVALIKQMTSVTKHWGNSARGWAGNQFKNTYIIQRWSHWRLHNMNIWNTQTQSYQVAHNQINQLATKQIHKHFTTYTYKIATIYIGLSHKYVSVWQNNGLGRAVWHLKFVFFF